MSDLDKFPFDKILDVSISEPPPEPSEHPMNTEELFWLSTNKYKKEFSPGYWLSCLEYKDKIYVDLRTLTNNTFSSKTKIKGISFNISQWKRLIEILTLIENDPVPKNKTYHLGNHVYLQQTMWLKNNIDIRERIWSRKNKQLLWTKTGISLPHTTIENLLKSNEDLVKNFPFINSQMTCFDTHLNYLDFLECSECSPYPYVDIYPDHNTSF